MTVSRKAKAFAATFVVLLAAPAAASAKPPDTWGQEVKACNVSDCYPGGTSRGEYVSEQADDSQAPGYAWEIQELALSDRGFGNGGF